MVSPLLSRSLTRKVLGCGLILALVAGCDRQSDADKQLAQTASLDATTKGNGAIIDHSHKGSRLPDLSFADGTGHDLRLATLTGKPVLINLWATWCGPCIAELPSLMKLAQGGKINVVAISQDTTPAATVTAFWQAKHLPARPLLDPQGQASSQWQVATLPTTIYYDAQGRELWRATGGHDWTGPEAAKLLAEAGHAS